MNTSGQEMRTPAGDILIFIPIGWAIGSPISYWLFGTSLGESIGHLVDMETTAALVLWLHRLRE